jgi:hypothetical protein
MGFELLVDVKGHGADMPLGSSSPGPAAPVARDLGRNRTVMLDDSSSRENRGDGGE